MVQRPGRLALGTVLRLAGLHAGDNLADGFMPLHHRAVGVDLGILGEYRNVTIGVQRIDGPDILLHHFVDCDAVCQFLHGDRLLLRGAGTQAKQAEQGHEFSHSASPAGRGVGVVYRPASQGGIMLKIILAGSHLLALSIGMMATVMRGSALREPPTAETLRRAFRMDLFWGIAAGLWLVTGLWRLLGHVEKPTAYYLENHWFLAKMGLFVLIVLLEIGPMLTLMRWRKALRAGASPASLVTAAAGRRIAIIGHVQATLALLMIFAAVAMARGYGM